MKNFMGKGLTGSEIRRLKRQLKRTRMAMLAERLAQAFWPLFVVVCLIAAAVQPQRTGAKEGPFVHGAIVRGTEEPPGTAVEADPTIRDSAPAPRRLHSGRPHARPPHHHAEHAQP